MMRRRELLSLAGAAVAGFAAMPARAAAPRVVVVGGGMAGAAAAKYLRLWSGRAIDVTLVEQESRYTSNIMSNLVVTGQYAMSKLYFGYGNLASGYGVKLSTGRVTAIEPAAGGTWKVTVVNGPSTVTHWCDRVVLAPGVQFDAVPLTGNGAQSAPVLHAWQAGPQTTQLGARLAAMPDGGTFVMTIPPAPYRCPPGPYERACVVADYLKKNKPHSKVIVLDANPGIVAEAENFGYAFGTMYGPGLLEYVPNTTVTSVSAAANAPGGVVSTNWGDIAASVLNVIPPHRAGAIVQASALVPSGRFAPVRVVDFGSTVRPGLHVIGDSSHNTGLPKAGHVGNQGAKICAAAIVRAFKGQQPDPAPTANSACFSPLSGTQASWLTAVYQYENGVMVPRDNVGGTTGATEAAGPSAENFSKMGTWYRSLMADTFA
jgi:sulfide dehydrogenase [flavocytochrome c] flavoprotein subunit